MTKNKRIKAKNIDIMRALSLSAIALMIVVASIYAPAAKSATLQQQINALNAENNKKEDKKDILSVEAGSLAEAINKLQGEIDASQAQINRFQSQIDDLKKQITEAETELAKQKKVLGASIRTMYVEGEISTVEMLATSKDLSDFFDKQQYRESVQNKIKTTLDKITQLKLELNSKKEQVQESLAAQQQLRNQLASQKAEKNRVLGLNQTQQQNLEGQIKANSGKIAELRRQQVLENQRLRGSGGGGGVIGGGGYPWGNAPCIATGRVDGACPGYEWGYGGGWQNWSEYNGYYGKGYAYRNCTDWVAWRGGFPGGYGNAKAWPSNAQQSGGTPKRGAAAVSMSGFYGHVMYVEEVHGDGSITVSDYNGMGTGKYDIYRISAGKASSLVYVYR